MSRASVLIPNYNNAPYIKEALESVLNQDFRDIEVLVVDDASTDNSLQVLESIKDPRLRIIKKEKNSGIVDALNLAMQHATGEYWFRMDADDRSLPGRFSKLVGFMDKNPHVGACSTSVRKFGASNEIITAVPSEEKCMAGLVWGHATPHAACVFRANVLQENGIEYSNRYPQLEDYDIFFRLKRFTRFNNIPDILYEYRIHPASVTQINAASKLGHYRKFYENVLDELELKTNDALIDLHTEFYFTIKLTHTPLEYYDHVTGILNANNRLKIYPESQLRNLIKKRWNSLCCRFIDESPSRFSDFKKLDIPISWKTRYYYLRRKKSVFL